MLTHGSWTDGTGWAPSLRALAERFEVVTWDRRGHSRSQGGDGPGSRDEDAADLAALIEHLGGAPVHVVGNSYGSIVVLTLVARRPELVASAVVHEPPLLSLLEGTTDPAIAEALIGVDCGFDAVVALIETGDHRAAAEYFVDHVALGPGSWARLPESFRAVLEANAPTFLDERRDPTSASIDAAALARTTVPLMFTYGTEGPTVVLAPSSPSWPCWFRRPGSRSSPGPGTSRTPPTPINGSPPCSRSTRRSLPGSRVRDEQRTVDIAAADGTPIAVWV